MADLQNSPPAVPIALIESTRSILEQFKVKETRLEAQIANLREALRQKDQENALLRSTIADSDSRCRRRTSGPEEAATYSTMTTASRSSDTGTDFASSSTTSAAPAIPEKLRMRHTRLGLYGSSSFALNIMLVRILVAIQGAELLTTDAARVLVPRVLERVEQSAYERRAFAVVRGWDEAFEDVRGRVDTGRDRVADGNNQGRGYGNDDDADADDVIRPEDVQVLVGLMRELLCGAPDADFQMDHYGAKSEGKAVAKHERRQGMPGEGSQGQQQERRLSSPFAVLLSSTLASLDFGVLQHAASTETSPSRALVLENYTRALASNPQEQDRHKNYLLEELLDLIPAVETQLSDWGINGCWIREERVKLARKAEEALRKQESAGDGNGKVREKRQV